MKTIGILGGMAPESTAEYYRIMISLTKEMDWEKKYPEMVIYSLDFERFYDNLSSGNNSEVISILSNGIDALERAGADFALMASNTPHAFFEEVEEKSPIPLVSIVEVTAEEAEKRGFEKVGLLGTTITTEGGFYERGFDERGISLVTPGEREREFVNDKIFGELVDGVFSEETKEKFIQIIERMKEDEGIEAVVLGCTELPLLIEQIDLSLPILNTTEIHALAALNRAFEG